MSSRLSLFDLPVEIRFMIYKLLFHPSSEPILISFLLVCSVKRSSQLLRVCRSCLEEASPVLYGDNQFALDWAYAGTEPSILDFFENIGFRNRQLIRHLSARYFSIGTLDKIRERRSLRPVLEGLDSLSLEFYNQTRNLYGYSPGRSNAATILHTLQRYLKVQRGPFRKLVKVLKLATDCPVEAPSLSVRVVSAAMKMGPKVGNLLLVVHPHIDHIH
jgi:hypothetical protein